MTEAIETPAPDKPAPRPKKSADASRRLRAVAGKEATKFTKADAIIKLLARSRGATLDDLMTATGWQAHSVRGFISGTLKKKLGRTVTSETTAKGRIYRIVAGGAE